MKAIVGRPSARSDENDRGGTRLHHWIGFLGDRVQEIGERIPIVLLSVWAGSAAIASLIFSAGHVGPHSAASTQSALTGSQLWGHKMRLIGASLLPLVFVPLLEMRRSGYDPALWLMNGILIVSFCSGPYFWLLARSVIGAVVLSMCSLSLLWHVAAWVMFTITIRMEAAKDASTVDTTHTLHAFLAPEYRIFFYCLCGMAMLIYCPVMMWIGYRRFLDDRSAQPQDAHEPPPSVGVAMLAVHRTRIRSQRLRPAAVGDPGS